MDWLEIVKNVFDIILGIGSILIAAALFGLARQQRKDTLLLNEQRRDDSSKLALGELHKAFWNDKDMKKVRYWLAVDDAYEHDLKPWLEKRNLIITLKNKGDEGWHTVSLQAEKEMGKKGRDGEKRL